jgi:hypothetical protein
MYVRMYVGVYILIVQKNFIVIFLYMHIIYVDQLQPLLLIPLPPFNRFHYSIFKHVYQYFNHFHSPLSLSFCPCLLLLPTPKLSPFYSPVILSYSACETEHVVFVFFSCGFSFNISHYVHFLANDIISFFMDE